MKVELSIDSGNLGDTVVDMFQKLTPDKREEIAAQVLREWLREPYEVEKHLLDKQAIQKVRDYRNSYGTDRSGDRLTEAQCRDDYRYREFFEKSKSTRQTMVEEITKQVIEYFNAQIAKEIETDPQVQNLMKETLAEIRMNYPKYVHDAMIAWFAGSMASFGNGIREALMQSGSTEERVRQIAAKVGV